MTINKLNIGKKISQISLIAAILLSGLSYTKLGAESEIYTEDGYFTREEIKEVNQMDTVQQQPLSTNFITYGYGGDELQPSNTTFLKSGLVFPNHTKDNGTVGDDIINIYASSSGTGRLTSISNIVRMTGVIPFVDATETRYRILVSGVDGWVDKKFFNEVETSKVQSFNYYTVNDNGSLIHQIAYQANCVGLCNYGQIDNGPAPSFLTKGSNYISFDGHYFYNYLHLNLMIQDYFNNVRTNSINASNPFYNYYQFLPYRAKTNYTSKTIEDYLITKGYSIYADTNNYSTVTGNSKMSKLKNQGQYFFEYGTKFTLNPLLTFGIAVNESGWGRSAISVTKNNIFGHGAIDASPGDAYLFESVAKSIYEINTPMFNWGYVDSDPTVYTNYNGAFLGDKAGGFNVMYASDPYWGQKAARTYYEIDRLYGSLDYQKSTVGFTKDKGVINVYLEPRLNAQYQYPRSSSSNMNLTYRNSSSILILGEVKGEVVNGSDKWYKVQSDFMMTQDRKPQPTLPERKHRELPYLEETSFYYIHSSNVTVLNTGSVTPPVDPPVDPPLPTYKLGDVNNDKSIDVSDILAIRRHILNVKLITGDAKLAADVNKDSSIDVSDILAIRRHILGVKPIQ